MSETQVVSGPIRADGAGGPTVDTFSPLASQEAGRPVTLIGQAVDELAGTITARNPTWFAAKRRLGTGAKLKTRLPAGRYKLRLVARDAAGRTTTATRAIAARVAPPRLTRTGLPPFVALRTRTVRVTVAADQSATLTIARRRYAVGPEARTISVPLPAAAGRARSGSATR